MATHEQLISIVLPFPIETCTTILFLLTEKLDRTVIFGYVPSVFFYI